MCIVRSRDKELHDPLVLSYCTNIWVPHLSKMQQLMIPQGSIFSLYTHTHTHTSYTDTNLLTQSHTYIYSHTHLLTQSHTHTIILTHVTHLNSNAGPNSKQYILTAVIHIHAYAYPESTSLDSPTRRW